MSNIEPQEKIGEFTLLFVDDEENILSSLKRLFRTMGYKILLANSGEQAIRFLEDEHIDLILSDMRMPEMSGAQLLEIVSKKWPETMRLLLTGYSDINSTIDAINKANIFKYISKPWDDHDLKVTIQHALELKFYENERKRLLKLTNDQNDKLKQINDTLERKVEERTEELNKTLQKLEKTHKDLKNNYISVIKTFSGLIELREGNSAGHSRRIANYARKLAKNLSLTAEETQDVLFAGLLHDIGKIGLSDELLNKSINELTDEELKSYKQHPVIGEAILMGLGSLQNTTRLIRSHHERYDGHGFPDGLSGAKIPLGSRILCITNDYDGLLTGTLVGREYKPNEAKEYLIKHKNTKYDPKLVDEFLALDIQDETASNNNTIKVLKSKDLKPGMIVMKDIVSNSGVLLLSEGYKLDEHLIRRIMTYEKVITDDLNVYVQETG